MQTSLIISSRNREAQLRDALQVLHELTWTPDGFEVVLVDTESADGTRSVMHQFAEAARWPVKVLTTTRRGVSIARNAGITAAEGDLLVFTDDDCYMDRDYFLHLVPIMAPGPFEYGAGGVVLHDPTDAPITISLFKENTRIPPRTIIPPGYLHGANFFIRRCVFEAVGLFREDMGPGAKFGSEDIELATRASLKGYEGALLPEAFVRHHHRRRPNSPELAELLEVYGAATGDYFANLLSEGHANVLKLWADRVNGLRTQCSQRDLNMRLHREFAAATVFLAHWLDTDEAARAANIPRLSSR